MDIKYIQLKPGWEFSPLLSCPQIWTVPLDGQQLSTQATNSASVAREKCTPTSETLIYSFHSDRRSLTGKTVAGLEQACKKGESCCWLSHTAHNPPDTGNNKLKAVYAICSHDAGDRSPEALTSLNRDSWQVTACSLTFASLQLIFKGRPLCTSNTTTQLAVIPRGEFVVQRQNTGSSHRRSPRFIPQHLQVERHLSKTLGNSSLSLLS